MDRMLSCVCVEKRFSCPNVNIQVHNALSLGQGDQERASGGHMGLILTLCTGPFGESHMWGQEGQGGSTPLTGNVPEGLSCQLHVTHLLRQFCEPWMWSAAACALPLLLPSRSSSSHSSPLPCDERENEKVMTMSHRQRHSSSSSWRSETPGELGKLSVQAPL